MVNYIPKLNEFITQANSFLNNHKKNLLQAFEVIKRLKT
jgi:hypothetical protein